ncbi:MAG: CotH kinase family protein [Verrucomicrobiales bacterium]
MILLGCLIPLDRVAAEPAADTSVKFTPSGRAFSKQIEVTLACPIKGSRILFTHDGSAPSATNGEPFTKPLKLSQSTQLRAIAVLPDGQLSPGSDASYIQIARDLAALRSRLPVMLIETFGNTIPAKGWHRAGIGVKQVPRRPAAWMLFEPNSVGVTTLAGDPQLSQRIGIRQRGSYSSTWREKPYSVEAWDAEDKDQNVSPLGMPANSDWNLYYPDVDRDKDYTMLYNAFMWRLSAATGRYAPRFRWVEVYANEDGGSVSADDRRGIYALVEKVTRDESRVPFEKLSEDGSTGGWLISINRMDAEPEDGWPAKNGALQPQFFHTAGPNRILETAANETSQGDDFPRMDRVQFNFESPGGYKINPAQRAAIEGWFKEFEDVLYDDSKWRDPEQGYRKYIDAVDFADFYLFNNLAKNDDGMLLSIYPWRSSDDGKLRMGPTWDFNWASYEQNGSASSGLMHQANELWFDRLFQDPDFMQLYVTRWQTLRQGALSNRSMEKIIADLATEIGTDNAVKQGIPSESEWRRRLLAMQHWLLNRARAMDNEYPGVPEFATTQPPVAGMEIQFKAGSGAVYFTTDGSDPRATGGGISASARSASGEIPVTLVADRAPARAWVPTNSADASLWMLPDFDDTRWIKGTTGVGFDNELTYRSRIGLDLSRQMSGKQTTAYVRIPFEVSQDRLQLQSLTLRVACDDGFAAWLNGKPVASFRAPTRPDWNSASRGKGSDSETTRPPHHDLTAFVSLLKKGRNVLAIQGFNASRTSSDFLIDPTLTAGVQTKVEALKAAPGMEIIARTHDSDLWSMPLRVKVE